VRLCTNRRRSALRRSHSPGVTRPPRPLVPAAGVGIVSQKRERTAAFRLGLPCGNWSERMLFASRWPSPAPVICPRQAALRPLPASRTAAVTARSDLGCHHRAMSGVMSSLSFARPRIQRPDQPLAVVHRLILHDVGLTGSAPRRRAGPAWSSPTRAALRIGDRVGAPGDNPHEHWRVAFGDRIARDVRIGKKRADRRGEGAHHQVRRALRRTCGRVRIGSGFASISVAVASLGT
jgi:hypothetical protein